MDNDVADPTPADEDESLQDEFSRLEAVAFSLGAAIDTMILVATQAEDLKTQRLIDAALRHAGLLEEGESAFETPPPPAKRKVQ
jgi:hypothetical protein